MPKLHFSCFPQHDQRAKSGVIILRKWYTLWFTVARLYYPFVSHSISFMMNEYHIFRLSALEVQAVVSVSIKDVWYGKQGSNLFGPDYSGIKHSRMMIFASTEQPIPKQKKKPLSWVSIRLRVCRTSASELKFKIFFLLYCTIHP